MKRHRIAIIFVSVMILGTLAFSAINAQGQYSIPSWVKGVAGFWAENKITDSDFGEGLSFLISEGIIEVPEMESLKQRVAQLEAENAQLKSQLEDSSVILPTTPPPELEPTPTTTTVKILSGAHLLGCEKTDSCFSPSNITIEQGTTVTWKSENDADHMVFSGTAVVGPNGIFESDHIFLGETFSYTFESTGTYQYFDIAHPWMAGVVIVQASSGSSETISFDVQTDKYWYENGDIIVIWGKVIPDDENLTRNIAMMVIDPNGIVSALAEFLPSEDGSFNYRELRAGGTMQEIGEYEIILQYGSQEGSKTIGYLG